MNRSCLLILAATALSTAAGCAGSVEFETKSPISINAEAKRKPKPPEIKVTKAILTATKIEIKEKVQFQLNSSVILPESFELLNEVSQIIKDHPEITKVYIEGHASSDGDDNANLVLSDARAKSVMSYLVTQGVEPTRLTAKGYGETKPIADNNTEEGRQANRRVEFNVEKSAPKK
ncbi:MAG: OmpA family protein [Polyangiaceae bacterium]